MLAQYQNQPLNWSGGSTVSVSGQSFTQAYQAYNRDNISNQSFTAYAGTTITVSGWINTTGLNGHPVNAYSWNTFLGVVWTTTTGTSSGATIGSTSVAAGSGWTYVTGTITVPANTASIQVDVVIDQNTNSSSYYVQFANLNYTLSFNGYSIIPMPTSPVPMQIDFEESDSNAKTFSPFTMQTQIQAWPGAEQMVWNVSMPKMSRKTANNWTAWMSSLRGIWGTFQMGDVTHAIPTGTPSGTPLIDGTNGGYNLPASYVLYTKGWTANTGNLLLPGDYVQIGVRLHRVMTAVSSDAQGKAVFNIWPSLREQPGDGQLLIVSNPQGLWRMLDNKRQWTERPGSNPQVGISFKVTEAR